MEDKVTTFFRPKSQLNRNLQPTLAHVICPVNLIHFLIVPDTGVHSIPRASDGNSLQCCHKSQC